MCRSVVKSIPPMLKTHHIFKREQLEEKTGLRLFDLEGEECSLVVESTHIQRHKQNIFFQKIFSKSGIVVHVIILVHGRHRQKNLQFETSLVYITRSCLQTNK